MGVPVDGGEGYIGLECVLYGGFLEVQTFGVLDEE